jgi:hypothetical protein
MPALSAVLAETLGALARKRTAEIGFAVRSNAPIYSTPPRGSRGGKM